LRRHFHEQIVLMLAVVNRLALAAFSGGKEIRISTPAHRPRLEADHAAHTESATAHIAIGHPHQPVDATELILAAIPSVVEKLHEGSAMPHQLP